MYGFYKEVVVTSIRDIKMVYARYKRKEAKRKIQRIMAKYWPNRRIEIV